ncbi:type I restriction endonuclease, partial [Flavobacterium sp.]|uniref:type I restriction endonuclease n=1 Tax=Flavobacterium sp. TaxID=239 RepID=UPI00262BC032
NKLKEMFLLDEETAKGINISINDSESKILEKFYEAEAKKTAHVDASIKASIDKLDELDTKSENYPELLKQEVEKLVKVIPLQNKTSLTHYVARRKLVLDLFQKILDRKLQTQIANKANYDEALIHNLLFQQQSTNSDTSDLWIINEDFIYFKGSSEKQLSKLEIDGKKVFKSTFTDEENKYLHSLGENRKIKRPDVLLFPDEGKCIIIEFKTPETNIAEHLTQINLYSSLIRNYSEDNFQITTFYGYLIGESIEPNDVMGRVSSFEYSYHLDYLFKPSEKVKGFNGKPDGSIYTEVIKYSTLLERARRRNKIFIDKLNS